MRNDEYAAFLNRLADLLEIRGEVFFKIRSYREAARQIDELPVPLDSLMGEDRLQEIPGVGAALAKKLAEYGTTGKSAFMDDLQREVPPGLLDFLRIPGLGPRTAKDIYDALGITTLEELEQAAKEQRLSKLPRIKTRTEENILKGLEAVRGRGRGPRTLLPVAMEASAAVIAALRNLPEVEQISEAGSVRRRVESIGDIDIVVASREAGTVMETFCKLGAVAEVLARGETKSSVRISGGLQVDLRVVAPETFGAALVYFTGSKPHNVHMRALALRQGLTLNEYGLARLRPAEVAAAEAELAREAASVESEVGAAAADGGHGAAQRATATVAAPPRELMRKRAVVAEEGILPSSTEQEVYAALGLSYVPPVLREDRGELGLAAEGRLPRLFDLEDVQGDLHAHTTASDGKASIDDMVDAGARRGYQYLAITDHSKSLGIIRGIEAARYPDHVAAVRAATKLAEKRHPGLRLLAGVEVNILPDGALDLPDELLAELDVVVASVHSLFKQPREQMTARICRAVQSPYVDVLGHPTGRKVEARDPYDVDLDAVFGACLKGGTAVEINASPARLDLNDQYARRAKERGLKLCIGSDAHTTGELDLMRFGVYVAQRAWLSPDDVINCWPLEQLLAHLRS
jgi:DNA polymerase (family 10)